MTTTEGARAALCRVDALEFHPRNVRRDLGDLRELAASIAEVGILQPLLVEDRISRGRVLAGHRRLAASRMVGLRKVPCLLVEPRTDDEAIAEMISENRHRVGLTPAEKTSAARALRHEFDWPVARIAQRLGVHRQTVDRWLAGRNDDEPHDLGARGGEAGRARAAKGAATRARDPHLRPPTTIGVRRVHDVVTRWETHAPPELLAELRDLLGGWTPT